MYVTHVCDKSRYFHLGCKLLNLVPTDLTFGAFWFLRKLGSGPSGTFIFYYFNFKYIDLKRLVTRLFFSVKQKLL